MSNWPQGNVTGREVYEALWHAQSVAHKKVYILASHSHFYMEDVFQHRYLEGQSAARMDRGHRGRRALPPAGRDRARGRRP